LELAFSCATSSDVRKTPKVFALNFHRLLGKTDASVENTGDFHKEERGIFSALFGIAQGAT
jgi:hypothetical protein